MARVAFKLLSQRKDGSLGPLFINRRQRIPIGQWLDAEPHLTKGYAFRPGWHCTIEPVAPHLSNKGRVWCKVLVAKARMYRRPASQGGVWILAERMKVVELCGKQP